MMVMDISGLNFLNKDQILKEKNETDFYAKDWTGHYKPDAKLVLFPRTSIEVQKIVLWALESKVSLVPSGGRTGLSAGALAQSGECIVSFEKMNQILDWNEADMSLKVQAGVITETVQKEVQKKGYLFPVDFGAVGSSHIGGNVATNAGGINVLKYGMTRNWVTHLTVVTGEGKVLNLGRQLIKNNVGFDLMNLFIASEGTLGLITEVGLRVTQKPKEQTAFLVLIQDVSQAIEVLSAFRKSCDLAAFEIFSQQTIPLLSKHSGRKFPLQAQSEYALIFDVLGDSSEALDVFSDLLESEKLVDGVLSESAEQYEQMWFWREQITESLSELKPYKSDISVRPSKIPEFFSWVESFIKIEYAGFNVFLFGHVGDGNIHVNITKPESMKHEDFLLECQRLTPVLFQKIQDMGGSISAEHGVGLIKRDFLHYSLSEVEIDYLRSIKNVFDPQGILNPGKLLPNL